MEALLKRPLAAPSTSQPSQRMVGSIGQTLTPPSVLEDVGIGAILGGIVGLAIGSLSGSTGWGAGVGAAVGGAGNGVYGFMKTRPQAAETLTLAPGTMAPVYLAMSGGILTVNTTGTIASIDTGSVQANSSYSTTSSNAGGSGSTGTVTASGTASSGVVTVIWTDASGKSQTSTIPVTTK